MQAYTLIQKCRHRYRSAGIHIDTELAIVEGSILTHPFTVYLCIAIHTTADLKTVYNSIVSLHDYPLPQGTNLNDSKSKFKSLSVESTVSRLTWNLYSSRLVHK